MVMNKLIEPELKPVPPRGDIFVLYCSHCLQQERLNRKRFSSVSISGGRGPSLSTSLTSHRHDLRPRKKASFKMVAILYTCFRFKYTVFINKIIPFEAANRNNNF